MSVIHVQKFPLKFGEQKDYKTKFFITFSSLGSILEVYDDTLYDVSDTDFPKTFFKYRDEVIKLDTIKVPEKEHYGDYIHQWLVDNKDLSEPIFLPSLKEELDWWRSYGEYVSKSYRSVDAEACGYADGDDEYGDNQYV